MKNFKKAISIFVTAMFILSLIPSSVMAGISYNTSTKNSALPWTGNDTPGAYMVNSDGSLPVLKDQAANSAAMPVIESVPGAYGKLASDEVYKTYDLPNRTKRTYTDGVGCYRITAPKHDDFVVEFTFSYEDVGNSIPYNEYSEGIILESYIQYYKTYACANASRLLAVNSFAARFDGVRFDASAATNLTAIQDEMTSYKFEPNKWYTITMVYDLEDKAAETDPDAGSYTYKSYVNGKLVTESTITTPYYGVRYVDLYPAVDATINWDNISYYTIDDATTFVPQDAAPELEAADGSMTVDGDNIYFNEYVLTADEVKAAFAASLKENETIRLYNEDYTEELAGDAPAIDAKLVVAGSRNIQTETTPRETIYSYYDIGIDGYMFVEPQINITGDKATGSVTLYNSSEEEKAFKVYLAVYNGNELVAINASDNDLITTAETKVVNHVTPEVNIASGNKVKLLVWNADDLTPELRATEESYTISDEYNPKNADLASVTLPVGAYNANYNGISVLYPEFDKDITEYTVVTYMKAYAGITPAFVTSNPNATVTLTTEPDTSSSNSTAVYTVTSADGSVTKDYTFNYITSNSADQRLYFSAIRNIQRESGRTCLAEWNGKTLNVADDASKTQIILQDGLFNRSATDIRTIIATNSIIEIDITDGPETIEYGFLRLSLGSTFGQATATGTVSVHEINPAIYELSDMSSIVMSNYAEYFGDKILDVTVEKLKANTGDMYFINIGGEYYNNLKAQGKTKMYIGLSPEVNDPSKGFSAVFGNSGNKVATNYAISCFDYITAK